MIALVGAAWGQDPDPPDVPEVDPVEVDLPDPHRVEDGDLDPDEYEALVRAAIDEAERARAQAVDVARDQVEREQPTVDLDAPADPVLALPHGSVAWVARHLPSLELDLERYTRVEWGWTESAVDDRRAFGWVWVGARLEWGLGRTSSARPDEDLDLVQVDGRWFVDDGTADPVLARAIERSGARIPAERADRLRRLRLERAALATEPRPQTLVDAAVRVLGLAELDALTDGTTSRQEVDMWWCGVAAAGEPSVDQVLARFSGEPTIVEVQGWAVDRVEASPEQVRRWLAQSRSAAWLPELSVDWRVRNDWDQGYGYLGPGGVDPVPGIDLAAVPEDTGRSYTRELQLGFRWQLDELVTSSNRIRMIGEAQDLAELRDKVTTQVTRLYFERRRLQVEDLLAPPIDPGAEVRDRLRLDELTASIDAATGGAFSRGLAHGRPPG